MSEEGGSLGRRVRAYRNDKGLTIEALASLAGVSKAMLSQIEQNKVNPTVAIMLKISAALGANIGDLIETAVPRDIMRIIPADDGSYTFRKDSCCTIRTLSPMSLEKSIEFYRVCLAAGGELVSEAHFAGTEEFLHLAKGRLAVTSNQQTAKIGRGDSMHYRADVPHRIKNRTKGEAEFYLIVRYKGE